jgi:hypothetical protein
MIRHGHYVAVAMLAAIPLTAAPVTFSATGQDAAAIQATVDSFRAALGANNGGGAGPGNGTGRREINWDGVPPSATDPNPHPGNFFAGRGAVSTGAQSFLVSNNTANVAGGTPEFGDFNAQYPDIFKVFSPQKLFAVVGGTEMDVLFIQPGTTDAATVSAFGAVFTDVDLAAQTRLTFFDANGGSLGGFNVGAENNGLSFLGVQFNAGERVARVHITLGNAVFGVTDTTGTDVVVMDDFIYSEPLASGVPEPSTMVLMSFGLLLAAARGLRGRRPRFSTVPRRMEEAE